MKVHFRTSKGFFDILVYDKMLQKSVQLQLNQGYFKGRTDYGPVS